MGVRRDWLAGGFVPEGGLGSFLPIITASAARGPAPAPTVASQFCPTAAASGVVGVAGLGGVGVGVRTPKAVVMRRRYEAAAPHRGYTPPTRNGCWEQPGVSRAVELIRESQLFGHTTTRPKASDKDTSHFTPRSARRPQEQRKKYDGVRFSPAGTSRYGRVVAPMSLPKPPPMRIKPQKRARDRTGPIETMRMAQQIGLRQEAEDCAAVILQAVARVLNARLEKNLLKAAKTIQKYIRAARDRNHQRVRMQNIEKQGRKIMKQAAAQKQKEHNEELVRVRFAAWWKEQQSSDAPEWQASKFLPPPLVPMAQRRRILHEQHRLGDHDVLAAGAGRLGRWESEADPEEQEDATLKSRAAEQQQHELAKKQHEHRKKQREQLLTQREIEAKWERIHGSVWVQISCAQ